MKNFFEQQDVARKNTTRLVILFGLAFLLTIFCLYFVTLFSVKGFALYFENEMEGGSSGALSAYISGWWDPKSFLIASIATIVVVGGGTLLKIRELARGGGSMVCEQMGGKFIDLRTTDFKEKRLINIVQEMAIASGVSVPLLYVLERESSINAFAAGFSANNAAIAVSQGALDLLTRDELQGVVAHEFSHILNGDMRMNIRMIGILHGILMIGVGGFTLFRLGLGSSRGSRRSSNDSGGVPLIVIGAALIVVGYGGRLVGRVIKSAISRQREYLADASAVQFTRNPDGLSGALKKIGGWSAGSEIRSANAEEISHMFFGDGVEQSSWFDGFFSTHPSLQDRIRRFEPHFSGAFPIVHPPRQIEQAQQESRPSRQGRAGDPLTSVLTGEGLKGLKSGGTKQDATRAVGDLLVAGAVLSEGGGSRNGQSRSAARRRSSGALNAAAPLSADAAMDSVGQMSTEHVDRARELMDAIPESIQTRAQDPWGAATIAFALLLDPDRQMRSAQIELLRRELSPDMFQETGRSTRELAELDSTLRLPLLEVLVPALRSMSVGQVEQFMGILDHLIQADQEVSTFEFALKKLLRHRLNATHGSRAERGDHLAHFYSLSPLRPDIAILLSFLAHAGSRGDASEAQRAFGLGAGALRVGGERSSQQLPFFSDSECSFERLDRALDRIAGAANGIKHRIVRATAACVLADEDVTSQEAQLLRVMCAVIDVPLPPFLPRPESQS